jgi:hypothetical protein
MDLLEVVREVRTTLAIDLSAAAGALEEDNAEVARDILSATSADLHRAGSVATRPRRDELVVRRRRRALIALPAVPVVGAIAMTAAAALSGTTAPHVSVTGHRPATVQHVSATSTLHRLEHVVNQHAQAAQVLAVADDLHEQLTQMIATSTNNPAQLHMVQQLLTLEQQVLEHSTVPGTKLALEASRKVAELLKQQPAAQHSKHPISSHSAPTSAPTAHPTPSASPSPSPTHRVAKPQPSPSPTHESPSPQPSNGLFGRGVFDGPRSH